MSRIPSIAITVGLIGSGVLAWAFAGRPLLANSDLKAPLNPFGINRSPYGEVLAMAMQGPIETDFHVGISGTGGGHHHADSAPCAKCKAGSAEPEPAANRPKPSPSVRGFMKGLLASMEKGTEIRTNPKPASESMKRYLRRQAEDKLRFTYQLDPAHYANYNALHFFLTEPAIGTRPELTPSAAKLAEETIQYCLRQQDDPRPALTAAAACTNILHLMFADQREANPKYTTAQMRQCLGLLDHCIGRYRHIAAQWEETKAWDRLSEQRITECADRISFICKIRDAAEKTIIRFEGGNAIHQQASSKGLKSEI
jgi:hypothetical protein